MGVDVAQMLIDKLVFTFCVSMVNLLELSAQKT